MSSFNSLLKSVHQELFVEALTFLKKIVGELHSLAGFATDEKL